MIRFDAIARAAALLCLALAGGCRDGAADPTAFRRPADAAHAAPGAGGDARSDLGRRLFFDAALSRSNGMSCASCHLPDHGWTDAKPHAEGWSGTPLPVRTPTLLNVAWQGPVGWDGKFADIEAVTFGPITNRDNMGLTEPEALAVVAAGPGYPEAFASAFGDPSVTRTRIESAVGAFVRGIVSGEAPFDRWAGGEAGAVDEAAKRGFALFAGKAGCSGCHTGWTMTDAAFHDTGIGEGKGRGRLFPGSRRLDHAWKTPGLRDVARRPPYMHDGSLGTLEAVVEHYDRGGAARPSLDPLMRPLGLSPGERSDLVAFLRSLDGDAKP